jgi:hypothetical protein
MKIERQLLFEIEYMFSKENNIFIIINKYK